MGANALIQDSTPHTMYIKSRMLFCPLTQNKSGPSSESPSEIPLETKPYGTALYIHFCTETCCQSLSKALSCCPCPSITELIIPVRMKSRVAFSFYDNQTIDLTCRC